MREELKIDESNMKEWMKWAMQSFPIRTVFYNRSDRALSEEVMDEICITFCFGHEGRGYVQGWSTFGRSGSSPFDINDPKTISKATKEMVDYLSNKEPVLISIVDDRKEASDGW